ncbi:MULTISPECIES: NAD(P)-dependent oxidoreductase [unclassified Paenibacillus]|uniref:NAD(P)-dependent oxidoreductase n=1 Tax=unclassified Paenibacillus TaxID=185978 RepID=UPI001AE62A64|nr:MULTISPECIES: NAD(P)-dependent oxidoreductase [unclassified Paenibacillus]MBP1155854.1 3-hydroxyisobutyrate dehydrogenase [Paenibacillus sp. PvP091]MBP1168760.1 3-hydroxyisobutyrate dehydrogenase [Paenibacillus sp. PvR098]MBP2439788.1 3-hydroxyisobutyrate dehydrogenase [Paenibacillus sp. PvP052]
MGQVVGVIGLGNMGAEIAKRMGKNLQVIGYDLDPNKMESVSRHGVMCNKSMEELAESVDVIILSLPKPEISLRVVQTISPMLRAGAIIVETSTVAPSDVKRLSEVCLPHQVKVVDAALLGGVSHAVNGTIGVLLGGDPDDMDNVKSILAELSNDVEALGALGAGMAAKIINNAVAHSVMVLIVEAAALAVRTGISREAAYKLLSGETALQRPLTHRLGERILSAQYEGGMSTSNARKDSTLALSLAQEMGVPLFAIQSTHTVYDIAVQEGLGHLDYASIAKLWEKWAHIDFAH